MTDLGQLTWILGIQFTHENNTIKMKQSKYIDRILLKFRMQYCKPRSTPVESGLNKITQLESEIIDDELYRKIIGSLMYLMTGTRPDLCYTVTKLSQNVTKPTINDLNRAKHVFRYLKATKEQSLLFKNPHILLLLVIFILLLIFMLLVIFI